MTREILENCKPASPERSAGICRRREKERGREGNKTDYKCLDDETRQQVSRLYDNQRFFIILSNRYCVRKVQAIRGFEVDRRFFTSA